MALWFIFAYWAIVHAFRRRLIFFSKAASSLKKPLSVSNSLDPDQARQNVGPDLGQNCLQWLLVDTTLVGKELQFYQIKISSGLKPV